MKRRKPAAARPPRPAHEHPAPRRKAKPTRPDRPVASRLSSPPAAVAAEGAAAAPKEADAAAHQRSQSKHEGLRAIDSILRSVREGLSGLGSPAADAAGSGGGGATSKKKKNKKRAGVRSLRKPKHAVRAAAAVRKRPSLAEQLRGVAAMAEGAVSGMGEGATRQALCEPMVPALGVGRLESRHGSKVAFHANRCRYVFVHPYSGVEIEMVMHYDDMVDTVYVAKRREFRFRIPHALDKFGPDYDPRTDQLRLVFGCAGDAAAFQREVLPAVRLCAGRRGR